MFNVTGNALLCVRFRLAGTVLFGIGLSPVWAQEAGTGVLAEVTVTAQRRSENLQDVPISVTALSADTLAAYKVESISELGTLAPGLLYSEQVGWAQPRLRGIGTTAVGPGLESPVAIYVDGVYYATMSGANLGFNNVEAVEVINGPQGTLFGRNATGGLIQVRTKTPSQQFSGSFELGYGNYQTTTGTGYVTGGITDRIAADLAVEFRNQGEGWGQNFYTGTPVEYINDAYFRSKWLFTPTDKLSVTLAGDWGETHGKPAFQNAPGTQPIGGQPLDLPPHSTNGVFDPWLQIKQGGVSLTVDDNLGAAHLLSITAYRGVYFNVGQDGSMTPNPQFALNIPIVEPHHQFTQEFQLASNPGSAITWTIGVFYFRETSAYDPAQLTGGLYYPVTNILYHSYAKTESAAIYGQATKEIASRTNLTLGLRYTWERRDIDISNDSFLFDGTDLGTVTATGNKDFQKPTWRVALDHKFTDEVMGYVSYNRGFKSGGFNPISLPTQQFAPETLDAYEVGAKSELFGRRLRLNSSLYYYDYKNIQVTGYETGLLNIFNGAAARLYGLDFDAEALASENLTLRAAVNLENAKFTSFPNADKTSPTPGGGTTYTVASAAGNWVPYAPEFTTTISADYAIPTSAGRFDLNALFAHNSGWYAEADNRLHQPAFNTVDGSVSWQPNKRYQVMVWGKNLTNEAVSMFLFSQFQGDGTLYMPPRTYGVSVKATF